MPIIYKILISIFLIIGIIYPREILKISQGWKYNNSAEPSAAYLIVNRILAAVFFIIIWFVFPS